jgi:predicted Zn-dependent peptidase
MKNRHAIQLIVLVAALSISLVGNLAAQPLKIGTDGYGNTTLANGITVVVNEDKSTQLSAARIVIGGGVLTETSANNGISNLMIGMLLKGNGSMTASQISEQLDFLGASVSADCFRDYTALSISSLTENFDKVLEIISGSLSSPTFPVDELVKLKSEVAGEIKAANDNQAQASNMLFWKTAFGDQGYGLPVLGTENSIKDLTADAIKAHYQKYVGGKNMVIAVATDLPADQIMSMLEKRFGGIKSAAEKAPAPTMTLSPEKTGFISFDRNQSYIYNGFILDRQDMNGMACINLLNQVMGANVGSRLWDLRQTEKLAYDVSTQWSASGKTTVFRSAIGTDTTKVKQALTSLDREWNKLIAGGITEREYSDAKVNMKNSLIFGIDRKAGRANNMATYEYLGYGYRYFLDQIALADKVTLAEVNTFAKTKLTADRKYLSIVGKK